MSERKDPDVGGGADAKGKGSSGCRHGVGLQVMEGTFSSFRSRTEGFLFSGIGGGSLELRAQSQDGNQHSRELHRVSLRSGA